MRKGDEVVYLSIEATAKRLGCSPATVRRIATAHRIGIRTESSRIVAIPEHDLPTFKPHIHETAGNPVWIAAKGKRLKKRRA